MKSDGSPPDSTPDDETYATNEAGEARFTGQPDEGDRYFGDSPDSDSGLVDPKVYGLLLLVGAVLLVFPEPVTSTLGLALVAVGAFVALVDLLSAS